MNPQSPATAPRRVLVVEDSPRRVRALLQADIIPQDARVAPSASEALQALLEGPWDEVRLDYDLMGEGNGGDVARALAAAPWRPVAIHIHSENTAGGPEMRRTLQDAGLEVDWIPITKMLPGMGLD